MHKIFMIIFFYTPFLKQVNYRIPFCKRYAFHVKNFTWRSSSILSITFTLISPLIHTQSFPQGTHLIGKKTTNTMIYTII